VRPLFLFVTAAKNTFLHHQKKKKKNSEICQKYLFYLKCEIKNKLFSLPHFCFEQFEKLFQNVNHWFAAEFYWKQNKFIFTVMQLT
jgi:hypothetical protein